MHDYQLPKAHYRNIAGVSERAHVERIAERLGATAGNISSRLSKLAAYGIIEARYSHGRNVYRALTYEQGRVLLS